MTDAPTGQSVETASASWLRCRPYVEAALVRAGGTHGVEDVERLVAEGRAHFWPGRGCAVVTEFYSYPRMKACNLWLLGGDLKELLQMRPAIEAWARAQGCTRILGGGPRRGWERVLRPHGYRPEWIIYCKDLSP
jgi:GNAT superfamily N-acetyltransferase